MGLPKDRKYSISFDIREIPGAIKSIDVTLGSTITRDQRKVFNINLCDDPLYPALVEYVNANPLHNKRRVN